jgi:hypothetical protein
LLAATVVESQRRCNLNGAGAHRPTKLPDGPAASEAPEGTVAKRSIQRLAQNPLAIRVLEGELDSGNTLVVDRDLGGGQLSFRPASAEVPAGV